MLPPSPGPKMKLLGVQTLGGRHRGRHFISVIKSLAPWATKPFPGPVGSQKYMFFPCPNGLLIELLIYISPRKIPKQYSNREILSQLVAGLFVGGGGLLIYCLLPVVELIQRKRGKKRCMLFRSPEKTQRIGVKLLVPTAQVPSLLGMATLGLLWSKGMLWKPRLTAGQTVAAHLHITAATSHSQSVLLFICSVFAVF